MATITFEHNTGTSGAPVWTNIAANTLVFSGSATSLTATISTTDWQDGTHIGNDDPGTDQCAGGVGGGGAHVSNVKFLTTSTMSLNAAGSANITDANLAANDCTLRIHLTNASSVATQNTFFYTFDGATTTTEAVEVECYAFERGVTATAWTQVNDDSANIGGDNSGERLDLGEKSTATDHTWYLALSARGESAGQKTSFDLGYKTEIF